MSWEYKLVKSVYRKPNKNHVSEMKNLIDEFETKVNDALLFLTWEPCGGMEITKVDEVVIFTQTLKKVKYIPEAEWDDIEEEEDDVTE